MGIADREWGGRQAPWEAAGRVRGLMCLGWAGKWRHENLLSVGCACRGGGGLGLPDRRTAGQNARLPGGRCQLGTGCGLGCAVRGSLGVSKVSRGRACCAAAAPGLPRGTWAGGPARPGITFLCGLMCAFESRGEPGGFPGAAARPRPGLVPGLASALLLHPQRALPLDPPAAPGNPVSARNPEVQILD